MDLEEKEVQMGVNSMRILIWLRAGCWGEEEGKARDGG